MRLDKYLASCTVMTRREIKKALQKNPAVVGGLKVSAPETQVDVKSVVYFLGEKMEYHEFTYILMNKPAGYVCTNREGRNPTVFALLDERYQKMNLFTVGRLDKDTTGLLIITNDGDLSHKMMHANKHVEKTYHVTCDRPIPSYAADAFAEGVDIGDDKPTRPAKLVCLEETPNEGYLTISEGRFHQVKRMMEAVGCTVVKLHRVSVGDFNLYNGPQPGKYREFNEEEMEIAEKYKNQ